MGTKSELRTQMLALRNGLSEEYRSLASDRVAQQLISCSALLTAQTIMTYAPFGSELNPNRFLSYQSSGLFATDQLRLVYPRVLDETSMSAYTCTPDDLVSGYRAIHEPPHDAPQCVLDEIDVILVPGVAFDTRGYRIGYGKGYYDCFLAELLAESNHRPALIGITYSESVVDDALFDEHDVAVDYLVTPEALFDCR